MKPIYRNIGRAVAVALIGMGVIAEDKLGHVAEVVAEGISVVMLLVIEIQSWASKLRGPGGLTQPTRDPSMDA